MVIGIASATRLSPGPYDGTIVMAPQHATLVAPARVHARTRAQARPLAPILIRVPTLGTRPHTLASPRGRRRLRSEVRVASLTLLVAMPLSWTLFTVARIGPARDQEPAATVASAVHPTASPVDDAPIATIGLMVSEPAPDAAEMEAPTVTPAGYLLPDNGPEETVHAGP